MPIRQELRGLYPTNWADISAHVRFVVARGRCQRCSRPHLKELRCLPDGRWFDDEAKTWRDRRGRQAAWPILEDVTRLRWTRPVLAAAHLDGDVVNNRRRNLRALCQRCHLHHDRRRHARQRWITYRRRYALGDLFLGVYEGLVLDRLALAAGLPSPLQVRQDVRDRTRARGSLRHVEGSRHLGVLDLEPPASRVPDGVALAV